MVGDGQTLTIENFRLHRDFPLSNFTSEECAVEFHFHLQRDLAQEVFNFNIYAEDSENSKTKWMILCSGSLGSSGPPSDVGGARISAVPAVHHPQLLEYAECFPLPALLELSNLRFSYQRVTGEITLERSSDKDQALGPLALDSILRLPGFMLLGSPVPSHFKLTSARRIEISLNAVTQGHSFSVIGEEPVNGMAMADIQVQAQDGEARIVINGAKYEARGPIHRVPPLKSLFLGREICPDVALLRRSDDMSLTRLVQLVTHKWPMCDIGIACDDPKDVATLLSTLGVADKSRRSRFRSVTITSDVEGVAHSPRVRVVADLDIDNRFHIIFASQRLYESLKARLQPSGIFCLMSSPEGHVNNDFHTVCSISCDDGALWTMGRPRSLSNGVNGHAPRPKLKILSRPGTDTTCFASEDCEVIALEESHIEQLSAELSAEPCDAIVLDLGIQSLLTQMRGAQLLPWVQGLLKTVKTLLWVSSQPEDQPFSGVGGAFIRTLCTENPSLKATSLVLEGNDPVDYDLAGMCENVYDAMKHGSTDIELFVRKGIVHTLRYLPDDELSASVGISPPSEQIHGASSQSFDYRISCEGSGRLELLATAPSPTQLLSPGHISVALEASFIDIEDSLKVASLAPFVESQLGSFFIGRVVSGGEAVKLAEGARVFGWSPDTMNSIVQVPGERVVEVNDGTDVAGTLYNLSTFTTATCLLLYEGRLRQGDKVYVTGTPVLLGDALACVATKRAALIADHLDDRVDICISYDISKGVSVNGRLFTLRSVLEKHSLASVLHDLPQQWLGAKDGARSFTLWDYPAAFQFAARHPSSTVLLHTPETNKVPRAKVTYAKRLKLFSGNGAYVILGGLGGLGRYLSVWMVRNGAKHIVTLSRRGASAPEAQDLAKEIDHLGGRLDVLQGDASVSDELEQALNEVRARIKVIGCINMAMVLEDCPFTTMSPDKWDRSIKSKVSTSWNLHNATVADELEFFVLCSSVVAMTGNRTQANYAVGNAFQNRIAEYRRSLGLTAVSIALPPIYGVGVLANNESLLEYFDKAGLAAAGPEDLHKVMEAAVLESRPSGRSFIGMGLQMFQRVGTKIHARSTQTQMFWADFPEFGFLFDHKLSEASAVDDKPLSERLKTCREESAHQLLLENFLASLANILGYKPEALDPASPIAAYGLDSLNAVACRYWFFKGKQLVLLLRVYRALKLTFVA